MIQIIVFQPAHLWEIIKHTDNPDAMWGRAVLERPDAFELIQRGQGAAFTALLDGKPMAAGGILAVYDNAYAWALVGKMGASNLLQLCKIVRLATDDIMAGLSVERCMAGILKEFKQGLQFAEVLGFQHEPDIHPGHAYQFMVKRWPGSQ
jgi:hypothetical protein